MTSRKNNPIAKVLDAGQGGTLVEVGGKLIDALELIERLNMVMAEVHGTLEPLASLDFHGKWRINKAINRLSIFSEEHAKLTFEALTSQGSPK
jgi:ATP-dependent protease HslVU (ClpYQ) peptidase subunit